MERDCIISYGATKFLQESMLVRGDDYKIAICNKSGALAIYNEAQNLFLSPFADGPIRFIKNIDDSLNIDNISKHGRDFSIVRVPYAFKLLMQELQTMNVQMRIITEDNIDQFSNMSFSNNIELLMHVEKGEYTIDQIAKKKREGAWHKFDDANIDTLRETPDKLLTHIPYQEQPINLPTANTPPTPLASSPVSPPYDPHPSNSPTYNPNSPTYDPHPSNSPTYDPHPSNSPTL